MDFFNIYAKKTSSPPQRGSYGNNFVPMQNTPRFSTGLELSSSPNHLEYLESVNKLLSELFGEREHLESHRRKLQEQKSQTNKQLKQTTKAIEEFKAKKAHLEEKLDVLSTDEKQLTQRIEQLDQKLSSINQESARFENSIKIIKDREHRPRSFSEPTKVKEEEEEVRPAQYLQMLKGHREAVMCVDIADMGIVSGGGDKRLLRWDSSSGKVSESFIGHTGWVTCVEIYRDRVVSGSSDKTGKVWNRQGEELLKLHGHQGQIACLQFDAQRIVTGSADKTVRVWDPTSGVSAMELRGHEKWVSALQGEGWGLVSASGDGTLRLWDLRTGECHRKLTGHSGPVSAVQFNDSTIFSGGADKTIRMWDLGSGEIIQTFNTSKGVSQLCLRGSTLLAAVDKNIEVYRVEGSEASLESEWKGHSGTVTSLREWQGTVVSGSTDCGVALWSL